MHMFALYLIHTQKGNEGKGQRMGEKRRGRKKDEREAGEGGYPTKEN